MNWMPRSQLERNLLADEARLAIEEQLFQLRDLVLNQAPKDKRAL
jgi:hypothetical protein